MRKLMWFTIGFGAACAFCVYSWICEGLIIPAIVFIALFAVGLFAGKWFQQLKIGAVICLGISLGLCWVQLYNTHYLAKAAQLDGKAADVQLYCSGYSYDTEYGSAVDGFLYLDSKPYKAKFYVQEGA